MLLTWREVIKEAWHHWRQERETLIPRTLPYILTAALVHTVATLFYFVFVVAPVMQSGDTSRLSLQSDLASVYLALKSIEGVIEFVLSIVLLNILWDSLSKRIPSQSELLHKSYRQILPFLWISILSALTVTFGFIALIIPGIVFSIWYFFVQAALLFDEKHGRDAFRFSHSLVRGIFWPVSYRLGAIAIVTLLLFIGVLAAVLIGARLLFLLVGLIAPAAGNVVVLAAISIFGFYALYGYVMLFATLMGLILYRNLRDNFQQKK